MEANCIILIYLKCRWQLLFIVLLLLIYFSNYRKLSHTHYFHSMVLFLPILSFSNGNLAAGMFRQKKNPTAEVDLLWQEQEASVLASRESRLQRLPPKDSLSLVKQVGRLSFQLVQDTWPNREAELNVNQLRMTRMMHAT